MTRPTILEEQRDFSLVLGGPLFQLFRRAHLTGDGLQLLRRRILVITAFTWVPLLLLSVFSGHALGGAIKIPFLYDIEAHVRFLIALPILIAAERIIHQRLRPAVRQFVERRIVIPEELPKFHAAIDSTMRMRNSVIGEVVLAVVVYTLGLWLWLTHAAQGTVSWYATPDGAHMNLTPAGYWYIFVSLPLSQFILLRWYLRFFLWFSFLWRISRLNLRLIPIHPDRAAGLGFLGTSTYAFSPILFAQGVLVAGLIASQIFFAGKDLVAFKVLVAGFLIFFIVAVFSPLAVFMPHLTRTRRQGLSDFGKLASRYVTAFSEKWISESAPGKDELLGNADIQSLADLDNNFSIVREMRTVPFGWKDVTRLGGAAAVPLLPLLLTVFSPVELLSHLIKVIF